MSAATLERVRVVRGGRAILTDVDLRLAAGAVHVLSGASGSGKSTVLRLLAGLDVPDAGRVTIGGRIVTDGARLIVAPHDRGVSLAFQDGALWEHLTVEQHLRFGLDRRVADAAERDARVAEALLIVDLDRRRGERPGPLSGGERQRVSIARAIVHRPALLLLDEPLAHLDRPAQRAMVERLAAWTRRERPTVLWVTHHPEEAAIDGAARFALADGRIVADGTEAP